jgi:hypothetical protein
LTIKFTQSTGRQHSAFQPKRFRFADSPRVNSRKPGASFMTSSRSAHRGQYVCCIQTAAPAEISKVLIKFLLRLCSYINLFSCQISSCQPPGRHEAAISS